MILFVIILHTICFNSQCSFLTRVRWSVRVRTHGYTSSREILLFRTTGGACVCGEDGECEGEGGVRWGGGEWVVRWVIGSGEAGEGVRRYM